MGDAPGQRADALHALGAQELPLQLAAFGDVGVDGEDGARLARSVMHQGPAGLDDQVLAALADLVQFP